MWFWLRIHALKLLMKNNDIFKITGYNLHVSCMICNFYNVEIKKKPTFALKLCLLLVESCIYSTVVRFILSDCAADQFHYLHPAASHSRH